MSKPIVTTNVRDDVRSLLAAARVVVDGYERHITTAVTRVRALLREGERWADEGSAAPAIAERYTELAHAYDMPCRCKGRGRCRVCRALRTLAHEFGTPIDLEVAALAAFRWIAGDQTSDLESALEELADTLRRVTDHLDASNTIMDAAYAAAGLATPRQRAA